MNYLSVDRRVAPAPADDPWAEISLEHELIPTSRACSSVSEYRPLVSRRGGLRPQLSQMTMSYDYLREDGRYLHTSPEELSKVLSGDDLLVAFEEDVYELLLDWVYYDLERRKQYFGLLFETCRLAYIPASYVEKIIKREELVKDNPVSYGAVVQYEKLNAALRKGVSASTRSNYERVAGGPRTNYRDVSILVCGGKSTERMCQLYKPATNSWRVLDDMPMGRSNAAVFSTAGGACFVGGEDEMKKVIGPTACYTSEAGWGEGVVVPGQSRSGARCVTLAGKTYLIGGITKDEGYSHSVERFNPDPDCQRWVPVKSMEFRRFAFGCAESGGFIYACGGFDGEKDLKECEFFMPDANEWTRICPMNVARSGCKTVSAEGKLYTIGGWNGTEILDSCEVYEPRSNRWTLIEPMNRARHGLEVVAIGNVIYAIGGWNGRKKLSSIERYHTRSNTWELLKPMNVGTWLTTALAVPTP